MFYLDLKIIYLRFSFGYSLKNALLTLSVERFLTNQIGCIFLLYLILRSKRKRKKKKSRIITKAVYTRETTF